MAVMHRTVLRQEQTFALGDAAIVDDLPVNPLSFVDITLRELVNGANTLPTVTQMLAPIDLIEVLFKGSSIIAIEPEDLFILQNVMGWLRPMPQPKLNTDNSALRITLRLSFSRKPWWTNEGFPASRRGELQLRITPAAAGAVSVVDTFSLNVETVEILDAQFRQFLKYTQTRKTPSATGEHDTDLPIGNPYAGILLFGTTAPTGTAVTASIRELRLLMDNQEVIIPRTRWDTLHAAMLEWLCPSVYLFEHHHLNNIAGTYTPNEDTAGPEWDLENVRRYAYLNFDPLRDGSYFIQTAGRSRVHLRINADVADLIRIIPIEVIELAEVPRPAGA